MATLGAQMRGPAKGVYKRKLRKMDRVMKENNLSLFELVQLVRLLNLGLAALVLSVHKENLKTFLIREDVFLACNLRHGKKNARRKVHHVYSEPVRSAIRQKRMDERNRSPEAIKE